MEKQVNGALNVLFCTQPESTPYYVRVILLAQFTYERDVYMSLGHIDIPLQPTYAFVCFKNIS